MTYSERAYFDGDHCQHVATREEALLRAHRQRQADKQMRRRAYDPTLALDECFAGIWADQRRFIQGVGE